MKRIEFLKNSIIGISSAIVPPFFGNYSNTLEIVRVSKTTPTLQFVPATGFQPGSKTYETAFKALEELDANYVRYCTWYPHPKLSVAELKPPHNGETFWDSTLIDPVTTDFLKATEGHPFMMNFSTIPKWMFETDKPVSYPEDPNEEDWDYTKGTVFKDPKFTEVVDYYKRLFSWYTQGGFTDEYGKFHKSGHYYSIPYWEVLNEPDFEHKLSAQMYTRLYDEIVIELKKISPKTKFAGLALGSNFWGSKRSAEYYKYFLDPDNHKHNAPVDYVTYHFYAAAKKKKSEETLQHSLFRQADNFLQMVRNRETIRERLSPNTKTSINELGTLSSDYNWSLCGALYAYIFGNLSHLGVSIAGLAPWLNYSKGEVITPYWVLKLINKYFSPGDKILETNVHHAGIYTYSVINRNGKRRMMLVNKENKSVTISLPNNGKRIEFVDQHNNNKIYSRMLNGKRKVSLNEFSVGVVQFS